MADFAETMRNWKKMCDTIAKAHSNDPCENCPLIATTDHGCGAIYEMPKDMDWDYRAWVINKWALENPVVYPTWREYLCDLYNDDMNRSGVMIDRNIPADIAEKLGIEPKE